METKVQQSPFAVKNIQAFIAFRVFFNARFYYPVFTILFLDFGLTLEQFAVLNAVWAATIVIMEVPSGALADIVGRKNLLVAAAVLMVVEMTLLCIAPAGASGLLFFIFFVNRVVSGAAEASASGADEALAYDSLVARGLEKTWPQVLDRQMRFQSAAFIVTPVIGAAVYDPELVRRLIEWLGYGSDVTLQTTMRFPVYLTLCMALLTLLTTLRMREPLHDDATCLSFEGCGRSVADAFRLTLRAGDWILKTPVALVIIVSALFFDHIIRMILTLTSQYYRLISLPEAAFGIVGSAMAVMGLFIPGVAKRMSANRSPKFNLAVVSALTLAGLCGLNLFLPIAGLVPMVLIICAMFLNNFFASDYLNRITRSRERATVLSFKGLALNLAYGGIGLLYALLLSVLRKGLLSDQRALVAPDIDNLVFVKSMGAFPLYFAACLAALLIFSKWKLRNSPETCME